MSDPLEGRRLKIPSTGQVITVRHVVAPEVETGWTDVEREHYGRILHEQLVTAGAPLVVWPDASPAWRTACGLGAEALYLLGRAEL